MLAKLPRLCPAASLGRSCRGCALWTCLGMHWGDFKWTFDHWLVDYCIAIVNCSIFLCASVPGASKPVEAIGGLMLLWCFLLHELLEFSEKHGLHNCGLDLESQIPQVQHLMICWVWFSSRLTGHPGKTLPQCADFSQCYGLSDRDGQSVSHGDNFRKLWSSNQSSSNFSFQSWCRVNTWQTLVFLIGYCWLHAFCFNFDV